MKDWTVGEILTLVYYLLLQDRKEEAIVGFNRIEGKKV